MSKNYPVELYNDLYVIAAELRNIQTNGSINLRTISQFSGLSVNSVKSVLAGNTANIASYDMIARAMGTSLIKVVQSLSRDTDPDTETEVPSTEAPIKSPPVTVVTTSESPGGTLNRSDF